MPVDKRTDRKQRNKRLREKNKRLRELAKHLGTREYWQAMNKIIREPVVDNSYPEKS